MDGIQQIASKSDYWIWRRKSKDILWRRGFTPTTKEDYEHLYNDAYKYYSASYNYTEYLRNILQDLRVRIGYVYLASFYWKINCLNNWNYYLQIKSKYVHNI